MKNIILLCASGITSSLLTEKLNDLFKNNLNGYCLIPCPVCDVAKYADGSSVILLTPQARFNYEKIQQMYPDKYVLVIDNNDYQQLNIHHIFEMIKEKLK